MYAALLTATVNPYHPPAHSDAALDTLLVTIGLVILVLLIVLPAHRARAREISRLSEDQPTSTPTDAGTR
jgi:hypothetical protein